MLHMREVDRLTWPLIDKALQRTAGSSAVKYSILRGGERGGGNSNDAAMRIQIAADRARLRDERKLAQSRQSLTGAIFGDPPPGYSALDRVKA